MIFGETLIAHRNALEVLKPDGIELNCLTDKFHEIKVSVLCQAWSSKRGWLSLDYK
jgi:hypothetical protein